MDAVLKLDDDALTNKGVEEAEGMSGELLSGSSRFVPFGTSLALEAGGPTSLGGSAALMACSSGGAACRSLAMTAAASEVGCIGGLPCGGGTAYGRG